ncbi:hypothetical protein [Amycolatopsis circi]|uniref:hypothetical protein n=1 Tax=Amycolatopsis circi TaxID=871959 RepID=UPI001ABF67B4|nr:hypothetical protein [Amycolatopsis circi]
MPPSGVELQPGGGAVALPITVRNDGGSVSDPVQATLNLPPGVQAVGANGGGAVGAYSSEAAAQSGPMQIACPGGTGTVTCKTGSGLQPGQSAVLMFRLKADENASGGEVTGSVTAGASVNVSVRVQVKVKAPQDALSLRADTIGPWFHPVVRADVQNTGQSTKPVTITFDHSATGPFTVKRFNCTSGDASLSCTSVKPLAPGETAELWVGVDRKPFDGPLTVTVNATLGSASAKPVALPLGCWWDMCHEPTIGPLSSTSVPLPTSSTSKSHAPTPPKHPKPSTAPPTSTAPDDETPDSTPSTPSTTTSAPPNPGSNSKPGKPDNHDKRPPSAEPRGFFGWFTE